MSDRQSAGRGALAIFALVLCFMSSSLRAAEVQSITLGRPVTVGATSTVDVIATVEGATSVVIAATGASASGVFASVNGLVVDVDAAGIARATLPLLGAYPVDGELTIDVTPMLEAAPGTTARRVVDATAAGARITGEPVVEVTAEGVSVRLDHPVDVIGAEVRVLLASAEALRGVDGDLARAASLSVLSNGRAMVTPGIDATSSMVFFPLLAGRAIPADGVVILEATVRDGFGRTSHRSAVSFVNTDSLDQLLSLSIGTGPVLLSQGFGERFQLPVEGHFLIAGTVDLRGASSGVRYSSSDDTVVAVTADGVLVARESGEATITASFGNTPVSLQVIVDSDVELVSLAIVPAETNQPGTIVIPRADRTARARLQATLSDDRVVDVTDTEAGAIWTSSASTIVRADPAGRLTARSPGTATIKATLGVFEATATVEVRDGAPTVVVSADNAVAGSTFAVNADAEDDLGVASVTFFVNGVPTTTITQAPWSVQLQAPPRAGADLIVSARVKDTGGQEGRSADVVVSVAASAPPSSMVITFVQPTAGNAIVAGQGLTLSVTAAGATASTFRAMRFYVDGTLIATSTVARIVVTPPLEPGDDPLQIPHWEVGYTPPLTMAGRSIVLRAVGEERSGGAEATSSSSVVRVQADTPPLLTFSAPLTSPTSATLGRALLFTGTVVDDTLALGGRVDVDVDGVVVAGVAVGAAASNGSLAGTSSFSTSFVVTKTLHTVIVRATDTSGGTSLRTFTVLGKADEPPQIAITSPVVGATYTVGQDIPLVATVIDENTTTTTVRWFVNDRGVASVDPRGLSTTVRTVATDIGTPLVIRAIARDDTGLEKQTEIRINVVTDTTPPVVAITTPRHDSSVVAGNALLVIASAVDEGTVTRFEAWLDDALLPTVPTTTTAGGTTSAHLRIAPALLAGTDGAFVSHQRQLRIKAVDASGNEGWSPTVTITIAPDAAPTITSLTPADNASFLVASVIPVEATVADDVGVVSVDFFVDGVLLVRRTSPPFRVDVTARASAGPMTVAVEARDLTHVTRASHTIQVVADDEGPLVAIRRPTALAAHFLGRPLTVEVAGLDRGTVADITLAVGGVGVSTVDLGPGVRSTDGLYTVVTFTVPGALLSGPAQALRTLTTVATDGVGNATTRTSSIRLVADSPPTVSISAVEPGTTMLEGDDVTLTWTAHDDEGVVDFTTVSGNVAARPLVNGPKLDLKGTKTSVMRVPLRTQPPDVGIEALDMAGQSARATTRLDVRHDLEAPQATLTTPEVSATPIVVLEGRSLGFRVDGTDNVRIDRVEVFVDDATTSLARLALQSEVVEETRVANPLLPGQVVTARRRRTEHTGAVSLVGVPIGRHTMKTTAWDVAGNPTRVRDVEIDVKAFTDTDAPTVELALTPRADQCVIGGTTSVNIAASDAVGVVAMTFSVDAVTSDLSPSIPLRTVSKSRSIIVAGPIGATRLFQAKARDAAGNEKLASISCTVVADAAPAVAMTSPAVGTVVHPRESILVQGTLRDDRPDAAAFAFASSSVPQLVTGGLRQPMGGDDRAFSVDLGDGSVAVDVSGGVVSLSPTGSPTIGALRLHLEHPTSFAVKWSYRIRADADPLQLDAFLALVTSTSTVASRSGTVELDFPADAVDVVAVRVELDDGADLDIGFDGRTATSVGWVEGTDALVVSTREQRVSAAEQPINLAQRLRMPDVDDLFVGFAANDLVGHPTHVERPLIVELDLAPPTVSVAGPAAGSRHVEGHPLELAFDATDRLAIIDVSVIVDGTTEQPARVRSNGTWTTTISPAVRGERTLELIAVAIDEAGNRSQSAPVTLVVGPDQGPQITITQGVSASETFDAAILASGVIDALQGSTLTLTVALTDDVGLTDFAALADGEAVLVSPAATSGRSATKTITWLVPWGPDQGAHVIELSASDVDPTRTSTRSLVVLGRAPVGPTVGIVAPIAEGKIVQGSTRFAVDLVAGDDTRVDHVDVLLNDQLAQRLSTSQQVLVGEIRYCDPDEPTEPDDDGLPVDCDRDGVAQAFDAATRTTLKGLDEPYNDPRSVERFFHFIDLPAAFFNDTGSNVLTLTLVAVDIEGNETRVERTLEMIDDVQPPRVTIEKPTVGQDFTEGTVVMVSVSAIDNASVASVEILAGSTPATMTVVRTIGGLTPADVDNRDGVDDEFGPFTLDVVLPRLSALVVTNQLGAYYIGARAVDINGNVSGDNPLTFEIETDFVAIDVKPDAPPAASISAPVKAVALTSIPVHVSVLDDVSVTQVELFVNGASFAMSQNAPFTFIVPVSSSVANLELYAVATDSIGQVDTTSTIIVPVFADEAPTVTIAAPVNNAQIVEGRALQVVIGAGDDVEVLGIGLEVTGLPQPLRLAASTPPYVFSIPLPFGSAGRSLRLIATATDKNTTSTTQATQISVIADTLDPTVAFTSPPQSANAPTVIAGRPFEIEVVAEDNVGVQTVTVSAGSTVIATMGAPPWRFVWPVPTTVGPIGLTAVATDASGNTETATVTVNVKVDEAPTNVSVTTEQVLYAGVPFKASAVAADDTGIAYVAIHGGFPDELVGDELPELGRRFQQLYDIVVTVPESRRGAMTFYAKAYDDAGQMTRSAPWPATVVADLPPTVTIQRPRVGALAFEGRTLTIEVEAKDRETAIASVAFYVDGRRIGTAVAPAGIPNEQHVYSASWVTPVGTGNREFKLWAVATDTAGHSTTSATRVFGTVVDTVAPDNDLLTPAHLDVLTATEPITLEAIARDNAGVSRVEFTAGDFTTTTTTPAGNSSAGRPVYAASWLVPETPGAIIPVAADAFDNKGNHKRTPPVDIEVGLAGASSVPLPPVLSAATLSSGLVVVGVAAPANGAGSVRVIDLLSAAPPQTIALGEKERATQVAIEDNAIIVVVERLQRNAQLRLYQRTNLSALPTTLELNEDTVDDLIVDDGIAYLASSLGVTRISVRTATAPIRLDTTPTVGAAAGLAVLGNQWLLVAGEGGLRVHDLRHPRLIQVGFEAIPGGGRSVVVEGHRAFVGGGDVAGSLVTLDLSDPAAPLIERIDSHRPRRFDHLSRGLPYLVREGQLLVSVADVIDQDAKSVKGLINIASTAAPGAIRYRANQPGFPIGTPPPPQVWPVGYANGRLVSFEASPTGHLMRTFALPTLSVVATTPDADATGVALDGAVVVVDFSDALNATTVTAGTFVVRAGTTINAPTVAGTLAVNSRQVTFTPSAPWPTSSTFSVWLIDGDTGIKSATNTTLLAPHTFSFTTRSSTSTAPLIVGVYPGSGTVEGGTEVGVIGSGFQDGASVTFGTIEASNVRFVSSTELRATTPAGPSGPAAVTVLNPDRQEVTRVASYIYLDGLFLSAVAPSTGSIDGGQRVELLGGGFASGMQVFFRDRPATNLQIESTGRARSRHRRAISASPTSASRASTGSARCCRRASSLRPRRHGAPLALRPRDRRADVGAAPARGPPVAARAPRRRACRRRHRRLRQRRRRRRRDERKQPPRRRQHREGADRWATGHCRHRRRDLDPVALGACGRHRLARRHGDLGVGHRRDPRRAGPCGRGRTALFTVDVTTPTSPTIIGAPITLPRVGTVASGRSR